MVSDDLRVGMKRAAADISRSKFKVYNFSTRHDLSEAATDELVQMLSNVGNILVVVLSKVFVYSLACLDGLDTTTYCLQVRFEPQTITHKTMKGLDRAAKQAMLPE